MPKRTHDGIKKRCDCPKKQWAKCRHPWWFNFHHGGREHRYSLDTIAHSRTSASSPPERVVERLLGSGGPGPPDLGALASSGPR